jgi:teichuronic acid biosynthesis glycosyltransferase TuaC
MRVLHLTPGFPSSNDPVSGVFVKRIADCLQADGVDVTVINPVASIPLPTSLLPKNLRVRRELPEHERTVSGVNVYRPRYFSYPKSTIWGVAHQFIFRSVLKTIKRHQLQFDLIHGHWLYPMGYVAIMLGQRLGLPVCNTMRGDDITLFPETTLGRERIKFALQRSQYLTSVSRTLARQARELADVPIQFIANGAMLTPQAGNEKTILDRASLRRKFNLAENVFYVLFVGAITRTKGIDELIEAAQALSTDSLKFIAIGYRLAGERELTLPPEIQFLGSRPHEEVMEYMRCCDVLALPSYREGMPNVVVEAASIGLPVVATDVGGVAELIDETTGYLIPAKSASELTSAIRKVYQDYPAALEKSRQARQRVLEEYDMAANARKLKSIYSHLLGNASLSLRPS